MSQTIASPTAAARSAAHAPSFWRRALRNPSFVIGAVLSLALLLAAVDPMLGGVLLGVVEVIKVGQQIIDANRFQFPTGTLWIYGVIFFMYFIVCWPLSIVARRLEKRWSND